MEHGDLGMSQAEVIRRHRYIARLAKLSSRLAAVRTTQGPVARRGAKNGDLRFAGPGVIGRNRLILRATELGHSLSAVCSAHGPFLGVRPEAGDLPPQYWS